MMSVTHSVILLRTLLYARQEFVAAPTKQLLPPRIHPLLWHAVLCSAAACCANTALLVVLAIAIAVGRNC
jgi:hypothetical protein